MVKITDRRYLTPLNPHVGGRNDRRSEERRRRRHPPGQRGKVDVTPDGVVPDSANPEVVLVGGGIMSATLAALLGVVAPQWSVTVFESAPDVAGESSDAWNNAGTGHAALCELNYTPAGPDGRVDPSKALTINEQFQVSRQFWSHLVRSGLTEGSPKSFITPVPHVGSSPARTAGPTCARGTRPSPGSRCSMGSSTPSTRPTWPSGSR